MSDQVKDELVYREPSLKKKGVPSSSIAARNSEEDANDNRILFTSQGRQGARIFADPDPVGSESVSEKSSDPVSTSRFKILFKITNNEYR